MNQMNRPAPSAATARTWGWAWPWRASANPGDFAKFESLELPVRSAIRVRLFATFVALLLLTALMAGTGIAGMRHNERTLDEFEADVMPEIARVLELAEKVAQLAAVAPSVADADLLTPVHADDQLVRVLLGEIRRLSNELPARADNRLEASRMLDGIDRDLTSLLAFARERRQLRAQLHEQREKLDDLGDRLYRDRMSARREGATLQSIWSTLVAAEMADEYTLLGRTEADVEALWVQAHRLGEDTQLPAVSAALRELSQGEDGAFQLRRRLLRVERELNTVVQLTRAHSTQLGERASTYVSDLRRVSTERRNAVRSAVSSGASQLVVVSVLAVLTALAGTLYGRRVLQELQSMTRVMTRLAAGDTTQVTPSVRRPDEIGELARAFQVFRDHLLEKQRLTLGMHAQGRLMESVFQSMNDGLSVYDGDGRLVAWNQKFASLIPFEPGLLGVARKVEELNAALPADASWQSVGKETAAHVRGRRIAASAELRLGGGKVLEFLSHPMPDGGWVSVCRDLSARRAIEDELRRAQRMEMLGQLTGGVAHDFNNFLTAILGNLELLRQRAAGDAVAGAFAARAQKAAEAAAGLSRRLLVFARRQPLEVEAVNIGDMLVEMQDLVEYSVGTGIAVQLHGVDDGHHALADRGQLENAILNLALNSAAAMPDGGTLVIGVDAVVSSERVVPPGEAVVIRVSDSGHGMPAEVRSRALEPFFTTKAPGEGTGLGLAIVDRFVRQSGGSVSFADAVPRGLTVELWLPSSRAAAGEDAAADRPFAGRARPAVLVVEDDEAVRATVTALFEDLGAQVQAASGELEAMDCLEHRGPFDLVLTDIMLGPGGDGVSLARRMRGAAPGLRVVLTSGLPPEVHARRAAWPEEVEFLQKPFSRKNIAGLFKDGARVGAPASPLLAD